MNVTRYSEYKDSGIEWLGEIPLHWSTVQSRRLFAQRKDKALPDDKQLTASQKHGVLFQDEFMELEGMSVIQVLTGKDILKHVEPNDFVISMRSFQGGIEWCGYRGCISSAYVMLIPCSEVYCRFFSYLFKSLPYIQALQSTTNLVRDGQALRYNNFTQIDLPVLPWAEQHAIAEFLERETAKIDALVEEQEKLISLLKEKRQAVISHAVTKGIDPSVPMKDSGIEWLGEVPEHWEVTKLKDVTSKIGSGKTPRGGSEVYTDSGVIFIRSQNVHFDGLRLDDVVFIDDATNEEMTASQVKHQDVLLNITGASIGRCCVVEEDCPKANVNQHVCILRPIVSKMIPHFLSNVLSSLSIQTQIAIVNQGTSREGLNFQQAGSLVFAYPKDLQEQHKIVNFLGEQFDRINTLMFESQRAVTLLKERRSALITAAVTGKIDVRDLVAEEVSV